MMIKTSFVTSVANLETILWWQKESLTRVGNTANQTSKNKYLSVYFGEPLQSMYYFKSAK